MHYTCSNDAVVGVLAEDFLTLLREKEDFFLFEDDAYRHGFKLIADAMSKALELFDDELFRQRPAEWRVKDKVVRSPFGEVGQLSFSRRVYTDEIGERRYLLDEVLDLPKSARLTPSAFDKLTSFGVETSYHATARLFNRHLEVGITPQTAMSALRVSAGLLKKESAATARLLFRDGVPPDGELEKREIAVEADGVWVARQVRGRGEGDEKETRSFEVKALVAYSGKEVVGSDVVRKDRVAFDAVATPDAFWKQGVAEIAGKFDLASIRKCHLGADGGSWCSSLGNYMPHVDVEFRLDQMHVNQAITKSFGDRRDRSEAFHLLYHDGVGALLSFMRAARAIDAAVGQSTATLDEGIRYIAKFEKHIDPHGVSMGTMESTNAHLIGARMKSRGGGWSLRGGDAMARARARAANGGNLPRRHREAELNKRSQRERRRFFQQIKADSGIIRNVMGPIGEGLQETVNSVYMPAEHALAIKAAIARSTLVEPIGPFGPRSLDFGKGQDRSFRRSRP